MAKRASSYEHVYAEEPIAEEETNPFASIDQGADSFNERFLTCTICLETYEDTPKLLPCLHSFCQPCITRIADGKSQLLCPVCRRSVDLPSEGAKGLPNNIFIQDLQDFLLQQNRPLRSGSLSAVSSTHESGNNVFIHDLQNFLSEQPNRPRVESERDVRQVTQRARAASAVNQPPKINKHASGNVFQRVALKIKLPFRSKNKRYCQYHTEKELKQYCHQCQQIVCKKCVRLEHSEEGHYVMDISVAADNSKRHLKSLVFQAQTLIPPLEHGKAAVGAQLDDLTRQKLNVKTEIEQAFGSLRAAIDEQQNRTLGKLTEEFQKHQRTLAAQSADLEFSLSTINSSVKFSQQTIEELQESDYDIVAASCPLVARMEEVVALSNRQRTDPVSCGTFSLEVNTNSVDEIRSLATDIAKLSVIPPETVNTQDAT